MSDQEQEPLGQALAALREDIDRHVFGGFAFDPRAIIHVTYVDWWGESDRRILARMRWKEKWRKWRLARHHPNCRCRGHEQDRAGANTFVSYTDWDFSFQAEPAPPAGPMALLPYRGDV